MWGTLRPSIVAAGVRVGGARPLLTVDRAEFEIELGRGHRPSVRRVRLVRPTLRVSEADWRRFRDTSPVPSGSGPRRPARGRSYGPVVEIQDGNLDLQIPYRGRWLRLRSSRVHLEHRPTGPRLLLGASSVVAGGATLAEVAAAAIDLDPSRGYRPARAALLGASLHPPGDAGAAGLVVHSAELSATDSGSWLIRIKGKPEGRDAGSIVARLVLGPSLAPEGDDAALLKLHRVDLGRLSSLAEPLGILTEGSRLSGVVRLGYREGHYALQTDLAIAGLTLNHPMIAAQPVGPFAAHLRGNLTFSPRTGTVRIRQLSAGMGRLQVGLTGHVHSRADRTELALDLRLPETGCQQLLASLPSGLVPVLDGMALKGTLGFRGRLRLDSTDLDSSAVDVDFDPLGCQVTADAPRADVRALTEQVTVTVSGPRGAGMPWTLGPSNPGFTPLRRISGNVRSAFVVAEDSRFFRHHGFDEQQLRRAFVFNLKEGRLLRGASTISQQLVKNLFLDQRRTLSRKIQEAVLTWRLEHVIPKRRILELYLNLVEMGPGIHGVGPAARMYFKRSAEDLSPLQAAQLAALAPSPRHLAQRLKEGNLGVALMERIQTLLRLMRRQDTLPVPPPASRSPQACLSTHGL
jgi:hypothetical protein